MAGSRRGVGAVVLAALCLLVGACTPSPGTPNPGETPSPTPVPSVSPSPTENAVERQQRLDFGAAEKSYREFRTEYNRVLARGGATEATKVMATTAGGAYLDDYVSAVRSYANLKYRQQGIEKIVYVKPSAHFDDHVTLEVCEDSSRAMTYDSDDKYIGKGEVRTARLEVRHMNAGWKIWSGEGKKVNSC